MDNNLNQLPDNQNRLKLFLSKLKIVLRKGFISFSKRPALQAWVIPINSILISFLFAAIILRIIGAQPSLALESMFQGAGLLPKARYGGGQSQLTDFMTLVNNVTPMIFAALAVAVALKAGLFNIGVSGQMIISGFVATVLIGYSGLGAGASRVLVLLVGIVIGSATGAIMGFLKFKFNINEVVQSIMFNYIYLYVVSYFISSKYLNTITRSSNPISDASRLSLMSVPAGKVNVIFSIGFIIAVIFCVLVWFLLKKTKIGYEIKAVGLNRKASNFSGINVGKNIVLAMTISGALAGLAGVTYFLGATNSIKPETLISTGFDAIAVTLLGNSHPLGIVVASFLISGMNSGSVYMQAKAGVSTQIPSLIIGLLLLFSACGAFVKHYIMKYAEILEEKYKPIETTTVGSIETTDVIPPETTDTLQSGTDIAPNEKSTENNNEIKNNNQKEDI